MLYRYSVLPTITCEGMLDCAIVEGSFNAALFMKFISGLLDKMNSFSDPPSVIVMNNCVIHKAPEIRELVESQYVYSIFA